MRKVIIAAASVLLLAGCSSEAGPQPKQGASDPGPDALRTKLTNLTADQCFTQPAEQEPRGCEKYVTQLANTAGTVHRYAHTAAQGTEEQARKLDGAIAAYRSSTCNAEAPPDRGACAKSLVDIAAALHTIQLDFG